MYIGIVYNFMGDYFFFSLDLTVLQVLGVLVVLVNCVAAAVHKMQKTIEPDDKKV